MKPVILGIVAVSFLVGCKDSGKAGGTSRKAVEPKAVGAERPPPAKNALVAGEARKLSGTYKFAEGPLGLPGGDVLFTDVGKKTIYKIDGKTDVISSFATKSGGAIGLAYSKDGTLYVAEERERRVTKRVGDEITAVAEAYKGKRFNGPQDIAVAADGGVYFTDPWFGWKGKGPREIDEQGVYHVSPGGEVTQVVSDLERPNGVALTADGKTLYVTDHGAGELLSFTVGAGGVLTDLHVVNETMNKPDGIALDEKGNVFVAARGGVRSFDASGKAMGMVGGPKKPTNVAFGGPGGKTLYITAGKRGVYAVPMSVAGQGLGTGLSPAPKAAPATPADPKAAPTTPAKAPAAPAAAPEAPAVKSGDKAKSPG